VIVVPTSPARRSATSGIDVDGDGVLGETQRSPIASQPDTANTDPEDLRAGAEIASRGRCSTASIRARARRRGRSPGEVDPITQRRLGAATTRCSSRR
jgi:hypothetical protein